MFRTTPLIGTAFSLNVATEHSMMSNLETAKQIFEAFARQDIPVILSKLAEHVEWEYGHGQLNVPWLQEIKGREAVRGFFEALGALDITLFHPKMFFENENIVITLLDVQWTHKETGTFVNNQDEICIWHFDSDGKVVKFAHRLDTHRHWLAMQKTS